MWGSSNAIHSLEKRKFLLDYNQNSARIAETIQGVTYKTKLYISILVPFLETFASPNPLLISTGFLKYPLELKKKFSEN